MRRRSKVLFFQFPDDAPRGFKNLLLQGELVTGDPNGRNAPSGHAMFIARTSPTGFRAGVKAPN